jgi:hypothetical protein
MWNEHRSQRLMPLIDGPAQYDLPRSALDVAEAAVRSPVQRFKLEQARSRIFQEANPEFACGVPARVIRTPSIYGLRLIQKDRPAGAWRQGADEFDEQMCPGALQVLGFIHENVVIAREMISKLRGRGGKCSAQPVDADHVVILPKLERLKPRPTQAPGK